MRNFQIYFHSVKVLFHSVTLAVGWNWYRCSSIMYYKKLWVLETHHISGHPRLLSAPVVWRNFTVWKQKHMWSTVSQHVLEFYWRKQLFVWEVKINECVLNKTKDGDRFQMKEDDLFLSKDRMLMWWRNTSTQASTARTEQTRRPTETLYTRRARAFNMCSKLLKMFHRSAVFFAAVCWGNIIRAGGTNRMSKLMRKAGSVTGCKLDIFEAVEIFVFLHLTCNLKFMFFFVDFTLLLIFLHCIFLIQISFYFISSTKEVTLV